VKPRPLSAHDPRQFPILYVDDEAANLRIFELTFRRDFTVLTAQSAEEGMRLLNENPISVVLSDHKMPGMTGVEFLSRVRELDENAIRILVTAYGDAETLGSAINDGRIYRYIPKPWDPDEMGLTLRRAIERYALDRERGALVEELTFLNWLSRSLHRELDPDRVVRLLIDAAHNELGFDGAAVLFFTPDRRALRWASIAPHDEVAERVRAIEMTRASAPDFFDTLEGGTAQAFGLDHLVDAEGPLRAWLSEVSAEETVVVPLAGQSGVIGALAIDNRSGGRRFGADDRTLLDGLSTQAVIALENARTVSALRSSRRQLQQADRLGLLGRLSMGLACDLEQQLEGVAGTERVREQLATLVRLGDAQQPEESRGAVDAAELAGDVVALLAREAAIAQVEVELELDAATPKATGCMRSLHQLLLTLAWNAIEATPRGGRVRLRVGDDPDEPGENTWIEISDGGPGMAPDELERVFEPSPDGERSATNLSLIVAHQIAREHGGAIGVRSAPGHGTTYEIRIPAESSAPETPA
jgi:signal transduction histidine kinase